MHYNHPNEPEPRNPDAGICLIIGLVCLICGYFSIGLVLLICAVLVGPAKD